MNDSRDRVIDALLKQHLGETQDSMNQRYERAFRALDAADAPRRFPLLSRERGIRLARAALIVLAAGALFFLLPMQTSASTVLAQTVSSETRASTAPGDQRYEIGVLMRSPRDRDREMWLRGTWDIRGGESRLELKNEAGHSFIRADSVDGAWEQRDDKPARTLDSRELWPRWIEDLDRRVAVERMTDLLRLVQRSYAVAFARGGEESAVELRGAMHLVASRLERAPGPNEIDLWIDTNRHVVLEARLRWSKDEHPMRPMGPGPGQGLGQGPGAGRPPLDGPPPPPRGPNDDDYRAAPGALPAAPPLELRMHRVEPIAFPAGHFAMPR
jgi:hypothetical protein